MKRSLGVCYYPEHWPEEVWAEDARRMAAAGLTWVRIGEFAWSRIEPSEGRFDWGWLDRAIEVLGQAGLKVVLGTPTATPPRWVVDKHPDMLAVDAEGRVRGFGSRRHYCFSHAGYLGECRRIVTALGDRYGRNPYVAAWQTDNEYGCHDTVVSHSDAARDAFRDWLGRKYQSPDALNRAWGNVFWSMEYDSFEQIGLPNLTVTEPNPAHLLDFRRFSSDQVVAFNRAQVEILRARSDAPIAHNYMGGVTDFDHWDVGGDLEIASWDSYPLGFLEDRVAADDAHRRAFQRQGDPDYQAFHHDLYRGVAGAGPGDGPPRLWIMEQQPGPVNWAPVNPAPLPGMVRLWTWEAFAHGAEAVCYFRWRQAPFAQEQMHAGLLRPDSADAPAMAEAQAVAAELAEAGDVTPVQSPVALIFDYAADWAWTIQPHGRDVAGAPLGYLGLVFEHYRALRRMGFSVDILPPRARDFSGYRMVLAPGLMHMPEALKQALADSDAQVLAGPRSAARTADFAIPVPLPPALPGLDCTVARVESFRADSPRKVSGGGAVVHYLEELEGASEVALRLESGAPVAMRSGRMTYCGGWLDPQALGALLRRLALRAGLEPGDLPEGLRCRETGTERFWFNYRPETLHGPDGSVPGAGVLRIPL